MAMLRQIILHDITLRYIMLLNVMSCCITSRYTSCNIKLHYIMLRHIADKNIQANLIGVLMNIMVGYVTLRHVMLHHVTLCYVTLRHVTLHHVTLRHVTLRHTSSNVKLCHIMLRHVVNKKYSGQFNQNFDVTSS